MFLVYFWHFFGQPWGGPLEPRNPWHILKPFFNADACKHAGARVQNALPAGWEHDHRNANMHVRASESARVQKCAGPNSSAYACKYVRARVQNSIPAQANMYVRVSRNPKGMRVRVSGMRCQLAGSTTTEMQS